MKLLQYVEWYLVMGKEGCPRVGGKITDVTKWPLITQNGPATLHYFRPLFFKLALEKKYRTAGVRSLNLNLRATFIKTNIVIALSFIRH